MVRRVAQTIARHGMFRAGERVGVAVSGGPDSVALLLALVELAPELGILLGVVHVNHQLRGAESDGDAEFTRSLAASLGLEFVIEVAGALEGNLEQAGRQARYDFFRRLIRENRFQKIAVGHTRSDQAETVLFRLLRGAGTAGLAGIYPVLEDGMVRPLIEAGRAEVLDYLRARGQVWREDRSNQSLELARNRLRHHLLPQLEREWNPGIAAALAQLAEWARDEEAWWQGEIERLAPQYLRREGPFVYLEASRVAALPAAAARRLLRHAVALVRGDLRAIDFDHIEQLRSLTTLAEGHGRTQLPGLDAFRSFDQVRLGPPGAGGSLETRNFALALSIPGTYEISQTHSRFTFRLVETESKLVGSGEGDRGYNESLGRLDWQRTPGPLWLRNWRPGDRYRPVGSGEVEKIKALFQDRKVPLWERGRWPVLVARNAASEETLLWSRGFGAAAEFAAGPEARTVLEITEVRQEVAVAATGLRL